MIAHETLRQHSFFNNLNDEQLKCLIESSHVYSPKAGEFLFHRDDELEFFYLVTEGEFEVIFETQILRVEYEKTGQPSELENQIIVLSKIKPGDIFGWSGLVKPFKATSCVRAIAASKVIAFNCKRILTCFDKDKKFGFFMIHAAAQVIGKRIHDIYKGG
jgi:CRP-like cAMP-binding protein